MRTSPSDPPVWTVHPEADALVREIVEGALLKCPEAASFARRMLAGTGVRFADVIDHLEMPTTKDLVKRIHSVGFRMSNETVARHADGIFPDFVLSERRVAVLALRVESVCDFLAANGLESEIEGAPHAPYRRARAWSVGDTSVVVVERHGHAGFDVPECSADQLIASVRHLERFRRRRRFFDDVAEGFDGTDRLIRNAIADLGTDWTCALFLRAEREYWQRRNEAGRLQKSRQDMFGLGWANEDHHTYDCSREWFHRTIETLELLGFECRERFYAGAEAGWGSQILEQPVVGSVVFADIDLYPEELDGDFAHARLEPLPLLRRAGLWCALHGESMLEAGLNHLECTFDSAALHEQLESLGIRMMEPFSNFPHLYQELTVGERWAVRPERVHALLQRKQLTEAEARDFLGNGAVGSHFENLERNQGFKGFNQPGISDVLRRIDPRANLVGHR